MTYYMVLSIIGKQATEVDNDINYWAGYGWRVVTMSDRMIVLELTTQIAKDPVFFKQSAITVEEPSLS